MVDPIDNSLKVSPTPVKGSGSVKSTAPKAPDAASKPDPVSLNTDSLVDSLRAEVGQLKNDLPSLVNQALLAPPTNQAAAQEPLNALIFRLEQPLNSILGAQDEVPEELVVQIREELEAFKLVFPALKNSELISPFLNDPEKAGPLSGILASLTTEVDNLIASL